MNSPDRERSLCILLVEDHPDTAHMMGRLLRSGGHTVHIANSVASALSAAENNPLDIIVSDIGLPDGSGIDLIRQIRRHSTTPAIALTGFGMEEDLARCVDAGFNAHVTKPVDLQKLEQVIKNLSAKLSARADDLPR